MEGKKQPISLCVEVTQTFALLPNVVVEVMSLPLALIQPLPLAPTISPLYRMLLILILSSRGTKSY